MTAGLSLFDCQKQDALDFGIGLIWVWEVQSRGSPQDCYQLPLMMSECANHQGETIRTMGGSDHIATDGPSYDMWRPFYGKTSEPRRTI